MNKCDTRFFDFGCVEPPKENIEKYNQKVFEYLTEKFGNAWLYEIRIDVPGLGKWWMAKNRINYFFSFLP